MLPYLKRLAMIEIIMQIGADPTRKKRGTQQKYNNQTGAFHIRRKARGRQALNPGVWQDTLSVCCRAITDMVKLRLVLSEMQKPALFVRIATSVTVERAMPRMKGADIITEYLIDSKIPYVFGICGHGNVGILDSLYEARDRITLVSPRHEQVAAHMADAYFRVRHEAVATLTSCGPGSCNIVMPLALAISDSSALLAITANVPTSQFNRSPFQEINKHFQADFPNIIRPVVKRSFQPTRVDMLPLALRQATTTMLSGRPGPVNVDVPFNVFQEED